MPNEARTPLLHLKLISCNVFQREACWCLARTRHLADPDFLELGLHVNPSRLRERLQARIDAEDAGDIRHDALLLLYGVCGNACVGLAARRTPLVIPRAHDCATVLLGGAARYHEVFGGNPSRPFSSVGYLERCAEAYRTEGGAGDLGGTYEDFVEKYGEDNAKYLWQTLHPVREGEPALFIDIPETSREDALARAQARLTADGRAFEIAQGDIGMIRRMIDGEWHPREFLIVRPGETVTGVYDMGEVIRAAQCSTPNG
ncbi:MAG: DUF1638 domain-containing protein [Kiritimatiellaeota bacterium]|nr:DUF1638 domain-containing protein [Kiritimatiellota bacterium]